MNKKILKSFEMTDAKISFLSTVDKAANKRQWIIAKGEDEGNCTKAKITTVGRIVKSTDTFGIDVPEGSHLIVGPVYEPMAEDAHGNFMTEGEIAKAEQWFSENGVGADKQHDYSVNEEVEIVKSWILDEDLATTDFAGNAVTIAKGAWMAAAIVKGETWSQVENAELTGWSMGGVGNFSTENVDLVEIQKSAEQNVFHKIAKALGFNQKVEKGAVMDIAISETKNDAFWNAWYALREVLKPYNYDTWESSWETDAATIQEALSDFNSIVTDILSNDNVLPLIKSLKPKEEDMKPEEITQAIQKALEPIAKEIAEVKAQIAPAGEIEKSEKSEKADTQEGVVAKANETEGTGESTTEGVTAEKLSEIVKSVIAPIVKDVESLKEIRGISKQAGEPTPEPEETIEKSVFAGIFNIRK